MPSIHPKVAWSALASIAFVIVTYELQKHGIWTPDQVEEGFLTAVVAFVTAYIKRADGEVPNDGAPLAVPPLPMPRRTPAANAGRSSADPEIEALRKPEPELDIPPKPAALPGNAASPAAPVAPAILALIVAAGLALSACTATQQKALTNAAQAVGPIVSAAVNTAFPQVAPVLTAAADEACKLQAAANAKGDADLSTVAGAGCAW